VSEPIKSRQWAYWDNHHQYFRHVYTTEAKVRLCDDQGFRQHEADGRGMVVPVMVTQIQVDPDAWVRCEDENCGCSYRQVMFTACPKCASLAYATKKGVKPWYLGTKDMDKALEDIRR
jgi:hypothetical protein